jgi:iron complex transport system substrate-binding protein
MLQKKSWTILAVSLLMLLFLLLAGCSRKGPRGTYTVTDVRGRAVSLPKEPRRVLTDSLHLDETLLTLVPPSYLAGAYYLDREPGISFVSEMCQDLPSIRQYTPETVMAVHPDVFFASTWSDPLLIQKVEEMGIPVFVCHGPVTVAEVEDNVVLMARVLHQPAVGNKVIDMMENQLNQIDQVVGQQHGKKPVGLLLSMMSRYGGSGSLYDELAARGGWINGLSKGGLRNGMELTREAVMAARPDFLLVSQPYPEEKEAYEAFQQQFFADPFYRSLKDRVRWEELPDRYVYDASPHLVYGIKAMANKAYGRMLFPEEPENVLKGYE